MHRIEVKDGLDRLNTLFEGAREEAVAGVAPDHPVEREVEVGERLVLLRASGRFPAFEQRL